jgi:glycosyltransferase involved in cell wall biosynthesis
VKLSVVIPVFRPCLKYLSKAVESLNRQTIDDFVVFWIFSVDLEQDVVDLITSEGLFSSKFLLSPKRGLSAALNFGLDHVTTEFVARFDADDICHPNRFELQLQFLLMNKAVDVCGSDIVIINDVDRIVAKRGYSLSNSRILRSFLFNSPLAHPVVVFRRSLFDKYRYKESYLYSEDLELFLRMRNYGVIFHNLPYPLLQYRELSKVRPRRHLISNLKARLENFKYISDLVSILSVVFLIVVPSRLVGFLKSRVYS